MSDDMTCFYADDCAVELSDDGDYYTVKSINDERAIVNLKVSRVAPAFHVGNSGTTYFGTDIENPWGRSAMPFGPGVFPKAPFPLKARWSISRAAPSSSTRFKA